MDEELDSLRDETEALWNRVRKVEERYDLLPNPTVEEQRVLESLVVIGSLIDSILFILP